MPMKVTIYHNPRCSKSRAALQLLRDRGIAPRIVEYLKTPPRAEELKSILASLGMRPRELVRTMEPEYQAAGLETPDLSDDELVSAMVRHPVLIERPIALAGGKAVIGRPPERVLEII